MRQQAFEAARRERWSRLQAMLDALDAGRPGGPDFPEAYRAVCQDLELAQERSFSASLVDRLHRMALAGHRHLYGIRVEGARPVDLFARRFPAAVRRERVLVGWVSLLFCGAAVFFFLLDLNAPSSIYHVLSPDQVQQFEGMYDPSSEHYGTPRGTVGDFSAFGFYIHNNIGIALRTFAWGFFFGIGSLAVVWFNGVLLGLVAAHVTLEGYAGTFFPFVIGHASFELTAVVLAGVAGLKLGGSLLVPGRLGRGAALRRAARQTVPLLYGVIAMLVVAAVIEAFWSANHALPAALKLVVGALLWVAVGCWLVLGGRDRGD